MLSHSERLRIVTLSRLLASIALLQAGLYTPEHFAQRCKDIASEYEEQKSNSSNGR